MTRRFPTFALTVAILFSGLLSAAASAHTTDALPLPHTMAAVGDSISQAASSGGSLGADYPQNSWSTGTNSTVNSYYLRLLALGAPISGQNHNRSVSGAKAAGLNAQMLTLDTLNPEYLTVQIGGNDVCTDTFAGMTSVATFRAQFLTAMQTLLALSPDTHVYVTSIPDAYQLWSLFKDNGWARFIWSIGGVCQSLLANPTSTQQVDVDRRAAVRQRNIDFNTQLGEVCATFTHCRFDNNAVFNTRFLTTDVAGDYFHPSIAGQAKLAAGTFPYPVGYAWAVSPPANTPPVASFTYGCTYLSCTFTDTSTDPGGSIASRSWAFGDGLTATTASPSHTYAAGGTYPVGLTVTDNGGASASTSTLVTVTAPPTNVAPTASFTYNCTYLACTFSDGSTDPDVGGSILAWSWNFGDTATSTATNPTHAYAGGGTYTVGLTVTDNAGAQATATRSVTVTAPPMWVSALSGMSAASGRNGWVATVTVTVVGGPATPAAAVQGVVVTGSWSTGATASCTTTGTAGTCSVASSSLSKKSISSVRFTVTGLSKSGWTYVPANNVKTYIDVARP
jgi:PKD repeat protein